jgi:hypothetical protein
MTFGGAGPEAILPVWLWIAGSCLAPPGMTADINIRNLDNSTPRRACAISRACESSSAVMVFDTSADSRLACAIHRPDQMLRLGIARFRERAKQPDRRHIVAAVIGRHAVFPGSCQRACDAQNLRAATRPPTITCFSCPAPPQGFDGLVSSRSIFAALLRNCHEPRQECPNGVGGPCEIG